MATAWVILALAAFAAAGVLVFRGPVRRDYLKRGKLGPGSVLLELLVFAGHANLAYLFLPVGWPGLPDLPMAPWQWIAGLAVFGLGIAGTLLTMTRLGFDTSCGQQPDRLFRAGLYERTRNPQLLFYGLLLMAPLILWPSLEAAVWYGAYLAVGHAMVLTEEEHLEHQQGDSYRSYMESTPRYL